MSLTELMRVCPPPASPVEPFLGGRLEEIRTRYGLVLPAEYIQFARIYGTGRFVGENTHEIFINNPFSGHYHWKVAKEQEFGVEFFALHDEAKSELARHRIHPTSLFPLGSDGDGAYIYWITDPMASLWHVLLVFYEWPEFIEPMPIGLSDLLVGYFTGNLRVEIWQSRTIHGDPPH